MIYDSSGRSDKPQHVAVDRDTRPVCFGQCGRLHSKYIVLVNPDAQTTSTAAAEAGQCDPSLT